MRVVIAPLEFKGTLTSLEAAEAIRHGLAAVLPHATFDLAPMADGGPGTLGVLSAALGGQTHSAIVSDALGRPVDAAWLSFGEGGALIETAQAIGLSLIPPADRDVGMATSRGAGELIEAALTLGSRRFFVAIGGSATNDGGRGMLEALGLTSDASTGGLDLKGLDSRIKDSEFTVLADVRNPLLGVDGATAMYAPQKGALSRQLPQLERRMTEFADKAESAFRVAARHDPGSGAAGGLGFAFRLLGARILPGAEVVAGLLGLPKRVQGADALFVGEGAFDLQSSWGKGVFHLLALARRRHVPVYGIFGQIQGSTLAFEEVISLEDQAGSGESAMAAAGQEVQRAAYRLGERMSR